MKGEQEREITLKEVIRLEKLGKTSDSGDAYRGYIILDSVSYCFTPHTLTQSLRLPLIHGESQLIWMKGDNENGSERVGYDETSRFPNRL